MCITHARVWSREVVDSKLAIYQPHESLSIVLFMTSIKASFKFIVGKVISLQLVSISCDSSKQHLSPYSHPSGPKQVTQPGCFSSIMHAGSVRVTVSDTVLTILEVT